MLIWGVGGWFVVLPFSIINTRRAQHDKNGSSLKCYNSTTQLRLRFETLRRTPAQEKRSRDSKHSKWTQQTTHAILRNVYKDSRAFANAPSSYRYYLLCFYNKMPRTRRTSAFSRMYYINCNMCARQYEVRCLLWPY